MRARPALVSVAVLALASAAGGAGSASAAASSAQKAATASQIAAYCRSFYAGDSYLHNPKRSCAEIGACFASHLKGVTIARFVAIARYNSSGTGHPPAHTPAVAKAEKQCDTALPGIAAFVDGTAGNT